MEKKVLHLTPVVITVFICAVMLLAVGCGNVAKSELSESDLSYYQDEESKQFAKKILSDPGTFDMPFDEEVENLNLTVTESPDGKVRFYSMQARDGRVVYYNNIYQTRPKSKVCTFEWIGEDTPDCSQDQILAIRQVESKDGAVYLLLSYSGDYMFRNYCVNAFKMDKHGELIPTDIFECAEMMGGIECVGKYYNRIGITFQTSLELPSMFQKDGWFDNFFFDLTKEDVYLPVQDQPSNYYSVLQANDFYYHYHWDGTVFKYETVQYNPALERYIELSTEIFYEFELGESFIRIDKGEDGFYRYIAWKKDKMFSEAPDLIINNGIYQETAHEFCFVNTDFEYIFNTETNRFLIYQTDSKTKKRKTIGDYMIDENLLYSSEW